MGMFDFQMFKKSVQSLAGEVRQARAEIEQLKRKREDIANAPAAKVDIKAAYAALIERRAEIHAKGFNRQMERFVRAPGSVKKPEVLNEQLLLAVTPSADGIANFMTMESGVLVLFKSAALKALNEMIDAMPWPGEGLPVDERDEVLAKLDKEIAELQAQVQELTSNAAAAGISIDM